MLAYQIIGWRIKLSWLLAQDGMLFTKAQYTAYRNGRSGEALLSPATENEREVVAPAARVGEDDANDEVSLPE